jgi:hypothetical protein
MSTAVTLSALAACASNPPPGTPGCFSSRNVQDWTVLNNQELIVQTSLPQDAYLIRLFQPVSDLHLYQNLGFENVERTGRICNNSYDYLIVRGYTPVRVPIVAVHQLTLAEQASLLHTSAKNVASAEPNPH